MQAFDWHDMGPKKNEAIRLFREECGRNPCDDNELFLFVDKHLSDKWEEELFWEKG